MDEYCIDCGEEAKGECAECGESLCENCEMDGLCENCWDAEQDDD